MLGNAVPSLIAEVLAREVRSQLFNSPLTDDLHLIPRNKKRTPPPVAVAPVPRKYLEYVGKHKAHPGTGKGRQAVKRAKADELALLNAE